MGAGRRFVRLRSRRAYVALLAVAAAACRDEATAPTLPSQVVAAPLGVEPAVVGSTLAPSVTVRGAGGEVLGGVPVRVEVTAGGGSLRNPPRLSAAGPTSLGEWTLGTRAGRNAITVTAGRLDPVEVVVQTVPDAPFAVRVLEGGGQSGRAGDVLGHRIVVRVQDRFENGIEGAPVSLAVVQGGGAIDPEQFTTDAQGRTTAAWWRLGHRGGAQGALARSGSLSAAITAVVASDFDPDLRYFGVPIPDDVRALFEGARERVRAAVVGDLPDVTLAGFDAARCGVTGVTLDAVVDDVVIFASVTELDGAGRILASAGPCLLRSLSGSVVIGVMRFDAADIASLLADRRLAEVILHEMLHVVGVGTLWRSRGLVSGVGTADPRFQGPLARSACLLAGGAAACGAGGVPIENAGGAGTIEVHWRESVFDAELMTGFAEPTAGMPLSAVTIFSLEDLGLQVNGFAADPFTLPAATAPAAPRLGRHVAAPWESVAPPRFEIAPGGWIRPLRWR